MTPLIENKIFKKIDYNQEAFQRAEYDGCIFEFCDFSGVNLSGVEFSDCEFIDCNLSNANVMQTTLNDVQFIACKLLGVEFKHLSTFLLHMRFTNCNLQLTHFDFLKLQRTSFINCHLQNASFYETDLTEAVFKGCNLANTSFRASILKNADFETAYNFTIDPEENQMKGAKFSKQALEGLLQKYGLKIVQ